MGCAKKTYRTKGEAIRNALHASKKRGVALRIYPCAKCHGLHLTSKPAKE